MALTSTQLASRKFTSVWFIVNSLKIGRVQPPTRSPRLTSSTRCAIRIIFGDPGAVSWVDREKRRDESFQVRAEDGYGSSNKKKIVHTHRRVCDNYEFSHDFTKIQSKKLSILLSFYFHKVLQHLKTFIDRDVRVPKGSSFCDRRRLNFQAFAWRNI